MDNMIFVVMLFILWIFFGSFASVIIHRIKSGESWILFWRSHCPECNHILWAFELIPIFSFLKNFWKCKYCKKKISYIYPILEFSFWIIFALVWYFLIDFNLLLTWNIVEIFKLIFFLFISFFSLIFVFYDILFLEISEKILLFLIIPTILVLIGQTFFPDFYIIPTLNSASIYNFDILIYASLITIFWIIWLYTIMLRQLDEIYDFGILALIIWTIILFKQFFTIEFSEIPILSAFIWALAIFIFFFLQIVISKWKWMWWWDLRIAIFIGLIFWINFAFIWTMIGYIAGSIIWVWIIIFTKFLKKKKFLDKLKKQENLADTQIPFWPFLAIWLFVVLFFQNEIIDFINKNFYL